MSTELVVAAVTAQMMLLSFSSVSWLAAMIQAGCRAYRARSCVKRGMRTFSRRAKGLSRSTSSVLELGGVAETRLEELGLLALQVGGSDGRREAEAVTFDLPQRQRPGPPASSPCSRRLHAAALSRSAGTPEDGLSRYTWRGLRA